jgi:hypothetical protein
MPFWAARLRAASMSSVGSRMPSLSTLVACWTERPSLSAHQAADSAIFFTFEKPWVRVESVERSPVRGRHSPQKKPYVAPRGAFGAQNHHPSAFALGHPAERDRPSRASLARTPMRHRICETQYEAGKPQAFRTASGTAATASDSDFFHTFFSPWAPACGIGPCGPRLTRMRPLICEREHLGTRVHCAHNVRRVPTPDQQGGPNRFGGRSRYHVVGVARI